MLRSHRQTLEILNRKNHLENRFKHITDVLVLLFNTRTRNCDFKQVARFNRKQETQERKCGEVILKWNIHPDLVEGILTIDERRIQEIIEFKVVRFIIEQGNVHYEILDILIFIV